jgi:hypothetical protein
MINATMVMNGPWWGVGVEGLLFVYSMKHGYTLIFEIKRVFFWYVMK